MLVKWVPPMWFIEYIDIHIHVTATPFAIELTLSVHLLHYSNPKI